VKWWERFPFVKGEKSEEARIAGKEITENAEIRDREEEHHLTYSQGRLQSNDRRATEWRSQKMRNSSSPQLAITMR